MNKHSIWASICTWLLFGSLASVQMTAQTPSPSRGKQRVSMGREVSFTVTPPWQIVGDRRNWVNELQITNSAGLLVARAIVNRENQITAERARQRLLVTAGPMEREGELFLFQGWPAYRHSTTERIRTRKGESSATPYRHHVLAIAAGSAFISIDVSDYSTDGDAARAVSALLDSVVIPRARNTKANARELKIIRDLRGKPWDEVNPIKLPANAVHDRFPTLRDHGFKPPVLAVRGFGELEITASASGKNVVIGTNNGYANSSDFGQTFTTAAPLTPFGIPTSGDPSTGYGVTGSFYLSYLGNPTGGGTGANSFNGCTVPVAASSDGGITWSYRGNARQCSSTVSATSNCFPDQEHIAVDERNAATVRVGGPVSPLVTKADQVYAVWREFSATATPGSPTTCNGIATATSGVALVSRASCSTNGGRTWTIAPPPVATAQTFDFSKITVGRDGRVYTVSALEKGDGWTELWADQFSSCKDGFQRQMGFPHVIGWLKTPTCPTGLDRCSNLASPTIAVSPEFGDLVWIGASFPSDANNDRIVVALSTDGARSFFGWRVISDSVPGRKFMPWVCVTGKHLFASWYDRRAVNAFDNSLTDFYLGRMDFTSFGPQVSANINMSANADSQCSSGWPNGTRNQASATLCTIQPQAYGICTNGATPPVTAGNCQPGSVPDLCGTNFLCVAVNSGRPKYGDYNGLGCAGGYAFAAWTTATAPTAGAPSGMNVWVRPYQADLEGSVFARWRAKLTVLKWWKDR